MIDSARMASRQYPGRPIAAVGAVVFHDNRLLLVQRGKPPREHSWTLPGGLIKLGETTENAVIREVFEECSVVVRPLRLIEVIDYIERDDSGAVRFHYVLVDYEAEFIDGVIRAGGDVQDAAWCSAEDIRDLDLPELTAGFLRKHYGEFGFVARQA